MQATAGPSKDPAPADLLAGVPASAPGRIKKREDYISEPLFRAPLPCVSKLRIILRDPGLRISMYAQGAKLSARGVADMLSGVRQVGTTIS